MVFDETLVGLVGGGPDFQFGVVLQPEVQPLSYCVLSSPRNIQLASFLNGFFQFLFDLRLCFAKDVLVDGLTCRWVMSCGIPGGRKVPVLCLLRRNF